MQDQAPPPSPEDGAADQLAALARVDIRNLPLLQGKVLETISLLEDPDMDFYQVIDQMSPDITAKFIDIAGSSLYGQKIHSIDHAVRLLGIEQMKQILATSVLVNQLSASATASFHLDKFHKQAQLCAGIAVCIGRIVGYPDKAKLFTVALLNNIGKLIIALEFSSEFAEIIDLKRRENLSSIEAERRVLGITHAEIGAIVLKQCHMPPDICNAVHFHENDEALIEDEDKFQLLLILRKASRLASCFALPDEEVPPQALPARFHEAIQAGQARHQQLARDLKENQDYRRIFELSVDAGAELIGEALRREFALRRTDGGNSESGSPPP
jgi:HD-like signal output (HDOD) protein